jgi:4'-phosphopantetheinyl transferase
VNQWHVPPKALTLNPQDVHVWQARLDVPPHQLDAFAQLLSTDERIRAERFKFEQHRHRFIAGRGILRSLLARYLGYPPQQLRFGYGSHGKPVLLDFESLHFNVAHSQDLALYAMTRDRSVGIDLEQIRTVDNLESLTRRFFSPSEHTAICEAEAPHQATLFFRYWTCKEAYLKATGEGLGKLGGLEIELSLLQPAQLKRLPSEENPQHWHLQELELENDFTAAIVVAAPSELVKLQQFIFHDRLMFL